MDTMLYRSGEVEEIPPIDILSAGIKNEIDNIGPLSTLLQYAIDVASDEFIEEEFYHTHNDILLFLSESGSTNMELQFMAFVKFHPDIFICKEHECDGHIIGGCPKMQCEKCNRLYFVDIENITSKMCEQCIASKIGDCTDDDRKIRRKIFAS